MLKTKVTLDWMEKGSVAKVDSKWMPMPIPIHSKTKWPAKNPMHVLDQAANEIKREIKVK